jgi:hypothetical protein
MTKQAMRGATLTMVSLAAAVFSSTAFAQTPPVGAPATAVVAASGPPQLGADDPNVDRGFLLPTAMTQPAGSVTYNNYELLLHGLTFGITDNVQASVTVLSPIVDEMPFVGFGAVKARLPLGERVHLAFQGSVGVAHSFEAGAEDPTVYFLGGGAFASACLREDCSSIASASATVQKGFSNGVSSPYAIIYGGSIVHRVSPRIKLLLEVASAAAADNHDAENIPGFLASYGVRFHTASIAADVGFIRPFGDDTGDFLMGLPFVSISYRWD